MQLGIDFGTWYTSAALRLDDGQLISLKDPNNMNPSIPSCLYLRENGEFVVGHTAYNLRLQDPSRYLHEEIKQHLLGDCVPVKLGDRNFRPDELLAEILAWIKCEADRMVASWNYPALRDAVITVPVLCRDHRRELISKAAEEAGFQEVRLLDEPVAAAIHFSERNRVAEQETLLVYDLGGGTFDTALLQRKGANYDILGEPDGLQECGGVYFDKLIYQWVVEQANPALQSLLGRRNRNIEAMQLRTTLLDECRRVKHQLSAVEVGTIFAIVPGTGESVRYPLKRADFITMLSLDLDRTIGCCREVVRKAGLKLEQVDRVLLVGGSCRIPAVSDWVRRGLGREVVLAPELELAICWGAALYKGAARTVTVSAKGEGDYSSIGAAIRAVQAGCTVLVKPGRYQESLVVDKSVEIVGDGPRENIIVESVAGDCLRLETEEASVRGLTLRCKARGENPLSWPPPPRGFDERYAFGVNIAQGHITIENCDIESDSLACVAIHGAAQPLIHNCRIHHGHQSGVIVFGSGAGQLVDCTISDNGWCGVEVYNEGNPVLTNCRIYNSQHSGVWVHSKGRGELRGCEIWGNGLNGREVESGGKLTDGVSISTGGAPLITHCRIYDSAGCGVWVYDDGGGTLEDCDIFSNRMDNVQITRGGAPRISRCTIRNAKVNGVDLGDGAGGTIEKCKVFDNTYQQVRISAKSTTVIHAGEITYYPPGGYDSLRSLLQQQQWDKADQETIRLIQVVAGGPCIDSESRANALSYDFLHTLDYLWGGSGSGRLFASVDGNIHGNFSRALTYHHVFTHYTAWYSMETWIMRRLKQVRLT